MQKVSFNNIGGNSFKPTVVSDSTLEALPPGNWVVAFTPEIGYYLNKVEGFSLPKKIYGDAGSRAERIIQSFWDKPGSMGVALAGEKGSGKTLLTKRVSMLMAEHFKVPTILVNQPYRGDAFNTFMQMIHQPSVVIFDEFEKVYGKQGGEDPQESILTLFEGVFSSKKLFLITVNKLNLLNEYFINRPGRVHYRFEYKSLSMEFIEEYCNDTLSPDMKERGATKAIMDTVREYFPEDYDYGAKFNFDMLQAWVEEINRFKEDPKEAIKVLNIRPEFSKPHIKYSAKTFVNDVDVSEHFERSNIHFTPSNPEWVYWLSNHCDPEEDKDKDYCLDGDNLYLNMDCLSIAESSSSEIVFYPEVKGNAKVKVVLYRAATNNDLADKLFKMV